MINSINSHIDKQHPLFFDSDGNFDLDNSQNIDSIKSGFISYLLKNRNDRLQIIADIFGVELEKIQKGYISTYSDAYLIMRSEIGLDGNIPLPPMDFRVVKCLVQSLIDFQKDFLDEKKLMLFQEDFISSLISYFSEEYEDFITYFAHESEIFDLLYELYKCPGLKSMVLQTRNSLLNPWSSPYKYEKGDLQKLCEGKDNSFKLFMISYFVDYNDENLREDFSELTGDSENIFLESIGKIQLTNKNNPEKYLDSVDFSDTFSGKLNSFQERQMNLIMTGMITFSKEISQDYIELSFSRGGKIILKKSDIKDYFLEIADKIPDSLFGEQINYNILLHGNSYISFPQDFLLESSSDVESGIIVDFLIGNPKVQDYFLSNFGVDLLKLNIQSSVHLVNFMLNSSENEINQFLKGKENVVNKMYSDDLSQDKFNFVSNANNYFLSTFLICSKDNEISDKIIKVTEHEKSAEIFTILGKITYDIDLLADNIYESIKKSTDSELDIDLMKIKGNLIDYVIKRINEILVIPDEIVDKLYSFSHEIQGIFSVISAMDISDLTKLEFCKLSDFEIKTYSRNDVLKNQSLFDELKSMAGHSFGWETIEMFDAFIKNEDSAEIIILFQGGKSLYFFTSQIVSSGVVFCDWLSRSKDLDDFNIRLTENFLKVAMKNMENIELIGLPDILTPMLTIDNLGMVGHCSITDPTEGFYGEKGDYIRITNTSELYETKAMSKEEILDRSDLNKKEFCVPEENQNLLNFIDETNEKGFVITRYFFTENIGGNKKAILIFEKSKEKL